MFINDLKETLNEDFNYSVTENGALDLDTIKNVVAWRIHEPYCPERSDSHDEE